MIDLVPSATHYAILFSMEFLEVLFERGVSPDRVVFFTDNPLKAGMASGVYGYRTSILNKREIILDGKFQAEVLAETITNGISSLGDPTMNTRKLAVIMNPPYQENDGGHSRSATPIYNKFIEAMIDIAPNYIVSIHPSRWMAGSRGRHLATLDKFRLRMVEEKNLREIVHFPGERDIFPAVSIKGGVQYFLWDKDHHGPCDFNGVMRDFSEFDMIVSDNASVPIIRKVTDVIDSFVSSSCLGSNPFGLRTNFKDWRTEGVPCYSMGKNLNKCDSYALNDKNKVIGRWKVATSNGTAEGASFVGGSRAYISRCFIIEPGAICTETYVIVNHFDTKIKAENFVSYMKTKFFRFLLGVRVTTQHITKDKFGFVPDLGDYTKPWTDAELYDRFKLTRQERQYVESKIKALK
jgi:hypothetical protein